MDFFNRMNEGLDKVCEDLAAVGSELAKATKDATENAGLYTQIAAEEGKIKEQYRIIGELYYKECGENDERMDVLSDAYREAFEKIAVSKWKIDNARETISKNKGAVRCPECGANVPKNAVYCSKCGNKVQN